MKKIPHIRIDELLLELDLAPDLHEAQSMILAGEVFNHHGQRLDKVGTKIPKDTPIEIRSRKKSFSSRGGEKLSHAIKKFNLSIQNKICVDIGASTGGFTDCLLKNGAKHVYAVDVAYGFLDSPLRNHPQVTNLEKTNARDLTPEHIPQKIDLISIDVSFISLKLMVESLSSTFKEWPAWILLFKPQFEVAPSYVKKGGIVKDASAIQASLENFMNWMKEKGFSLINGPEASPLPGKRSGNVEYLLYYERKKHE